MHYVGRSSGDGISGQSKALEIPRQRPCGPKFFIGRRDVVVRYDEPMNRVSSAFKEGSFEFEDGILASKSLVSVMDEEQSHANAVCGYYLEWLRCEETTGKAGTHSLLSRAFTESKAPRPFNVPSLRDLPYQVHRSVAFECMESPEMQKQVLQETFYQNIRSRILQPTE